MLWTSLGVLDVSPLLPSALSALCLAFLATLAASGLL